MTDDEFNTEELAASLSKSSRIPIAPGSFEDNRPAEIPEPRPSLAGALLRTENPFVSAFQHLRREAEIQNIPALPGYNWRDGVPIDLKEFEWQYINADSPLKAQEVTFGIRQRQADRARIAETPVQAFGMSLLLAPLDISNYVPLGAIYKEFNLGRNMFQSAKSVAFANMVTTVPLEAALMWSQADREFKEAAANTTGAGVFGGMFGAGAAFIGSKIAKNAKYDVVDTMINGLGEPKERPLNRYTTKAEAVTQMETHNAKKAERQGFDEAIDSAKESNTIFKETHAQASSEAKKSGKSIYSDMSIDDIIHAIKTSDFAINTHNMVAAFAKNVPIPASVIKRSYLYAKLSKNELIKLAQESDAALLKAMAHDEKTFSVMSQDQASMIASANNSAAHARMNTEQAINAAANIPELSKFGDVKTKPVVDTSVTPETPKGNKQTISSAQSSYVSEEKTLADLLDMETLSGGGRFTLGLTSFISPRNSMMNSSNPYVRQLADMFFESNWIKNKFNPEGANVARDISVETNMKVLFGKVTKAIKKYEDIFYEQAGIGKIGVFKPERALLSKQGLSVAEFGNEVSFALRNGDIHDNNYVQRAAQLLRKDGFDPLKEIAIAQGRLPENVSVETANSYLTRLFNNQFIKENQESFYSDIFPWFKQKNEELREMQPMIRARQAEIKASELELRSALTPAGQKQVSTRVKELESSLKMIQDIESKVSDAELELSTALKGEDKKAIRARISELKKASKKISSESIESEVAELKDNQKRIGELEEHLQTARSYLKNAPTLEERNVIREIINDLKKNLRDADKKGTRESLATLESFKPAISDVEMQIKTAEADLKKASSGEDIKAIRSKINELKTSLRSANKKRVESRIEELKARLERPDRESVAARIEQLKEDLDKSVPKDLKDSEGNIRTVIEDPDQMQAVIEQTIENVLGRNMEKLSNPLSKSGASATATPLHNRAWLIDDNTVAKYLVNDPIEVLETYAKEMIPELQLTELAKKVFEPSRINARLNALTEQLELAKSNKSDNLTIGRIQDRIDIENKKVAEINSRLEENQGEPTIEMAVSQMMREATDHRNAQLKGASPEEAAKIEKSFSVDEKNILDSIDILKGVYKNGSNTLNGTAGTVLRNIKKWNYLRYMGYMMISSLPDLAMHVLRHGPMAFVQEGLMPAFKQLSGLENLQFNKELLYDLGRCMETSMGQRLKAFADGEATVVCPGKITKALDYMSNRYGNATLFNQWQDQMQFMAGNMSISRTLRSIDNWVKTGQISKSDKLRMNALGLDESYWPTIHKEWKKNGGIQDGSYWSDYGSWDVSNPGVADAYHVFKASIINEIDSTNVRVNMGDKPRIAYDSTFGVILQFRAFMLAATNTVLTSGLSRNDQNFYLGMISLMGMGGLAYTISSKLKRPDEEVDLSPTTLLLNSVDRSGALGVFMEGWNIGRKFIPIDGGVSRYQSRSKLGNLLGPTAQAIDDIAYVLNAAQNSLSEDGETLNTKDIQKTKALGPLQNLWWSDYATKILLNKAAVSLGAEEA